MNVLPSLSAPSKSTVTRYTLTLISIFILFSYLAHANPSKSSHSDIGPEVGKKAPAITVINSQKSAVMIESLAKDKGLIILFFRSADWCPYCKKHLIELNNLAEAFNQLGYGLAGISYDNTEILETFSAQKKIAYPLLSDQKSQTMLAYNILHKDYSQGDDNYGIPYPGVVVINNEGDVIHKYFYQGYKNRVKFDDLYSTLKNRVIEQK